MFISILSIDTSSIRKNTSDRIILRSKTKILTTVTCTFSFAIFDQQPIEYARNMAGVRRRFYEPRGVYRGRKYLYTRHAGVHQSTIFYKFTIKKNKIHAVNSPINYPFHLDIQILPNLANFFVVFSYFYYRETNFTK